MKKVIYALLVLAIFMSSTEPLALAATSPEPAKKDEPTSKEYIKRGILYYDPGQINCDENLASINSAAPAPETENLKQFVKTYAPAAIRVGNEYKLPPVAIIAQAALESGNGQSSLTREAYNFFGIKASSGWDGPVWTGSTQEEVNGQRITINAGFRKYKNADEGFSGYGDFIHKNSIYKKALDYPDDPVKYITELKNAGYATDSKYISSNLSIQKTVKKYLNDFNIKINSISLSATGGVGGSDMPKPNSNKSKVWQFFASKGLSSVQIAGIMGNLEAESGYNPGITNSIGAYGIAQWLGGRKSQLTNYEGQAKNKDKSKLEIQLNFMWDEELSKGWRASTLTPLKKSDSLAESVEIILKKYEIPCGENTCWQSEQKKRQDFAKKALEEYGDLGAVADVSSGNGCNSTTQNLLYKTSGYGYDINKSSGTSMVYHSQFDAEWRDILYSSKIPKDPNQTIGKSGCGPTSISMVVETLTGKKFSPIEAAEWSVKNGHRTADEGTSNSAFPAAAKKFNLEIEDLGSKGFAGVEDTLKNKGLVIASVGKGTFTEKGHILVIRKVDGDKFYLADPISEDGITNGQSNKKGYTKEELEGPGNVINMWGFTAQNLVEI